MSRFLYIRRRVGASLRRPRSSGHSGRQGGKLSGIHVLLLAALTLSAFCVTVFWIDGHLRPIITQLAEARVHYLASKAINDAVNQKIIEGDINYDSIILFEKDVTGQITALKTNISAINRLRSEIINQVLINIHDIGTSDLSIPLGNVFSGELLSGRGPNIPVRIVPVGVAHASFENVFTSAGINQTRHQIFMNIEAEIGLLLPGYETSSKVTVAVSLAETIIVGAVPNQYTNLDEGVFAVNK